jgi:hypothetical protein
VGASCAGGDGAGDVGGDWGLGLRAGVEIFGGLKKAIQVVAAAPSLGPSAER